MVAFVFTRFAEKKFVKLDKSIRERITEKLTELKRKEGIDTVLKSLTNFEPATHRLRVGHYRLILQRTSKNDFLVLDVGHRSDIYQ